MSNLFILNDSFLNGFNYDFLNIISLLSVLCSITVIISKNPVVSVLFLIGLFLNIAGYLMMLGLNFIGLSYLLVYVGAVSILFLFILMLINIRISELVTDNNNSTPLALLIILIFNLTLYRLLPSNSGVISYTSNINTISFFAQIKERMNTGGFISSNSGLQHVTSQIWDGLLSEASHIASIGNIIYTIYPLWLILTSVILLLAMVGAIIITIKQ